MCCGGEGAVRGEPRGLGRPAGLSRTRPRGPAWQALLLADEDGSGNDAAVERKRRACSMTAEKARPRKDSEMSTLEHAERCRALALEFRAP